MRKYKQLATERQTVIEFQESQIVEIKEECETKIKKEIEKCRTELSYCRIEAEEFSSKAENQNNAKFRIYEDNIRSLQRELDSRECRIVALEEQLDTKEGINSYYYEDYNQSINRMSNVKNTLLNVLEGINDTLCEINVSRPGSAASSCHYDDDRRSYESDYPSYMTPLGSAKFLGRYPSSHFCDSAFSSYIPPTY